MSSQILVATRKGLFTLERGASGVWTIERTDFVGDNVSTALVDPRDGTCYAALEHGHFGCKLHRAASLGQPWQEVGVPVYPKQPDGEVDRDQMGRVIAWNLVKIWVLEPGATSEPGVMWAGTLPGGLFRSADRGQSWELICAAPGATFEVFFTNPMCSPGEHLATTVFSCQKGADVLVCLKD